tara:strand:+ start:481 stop:1086 length:606 start_codon:yes stop_codon:yes gene_type:complete
MKKSYNQFTIGKGIILTDKKLQLKNIKTFTGRQGIGCSATIYFEGKKCGTFLDEANGAEYFIDWNYNCKVADSAWEYIKNLPKFSDEEYKKDIGHEVESYDSSERDNNWKWYWSDIIIENHLNKKQYNKWLQKVIIYNSKDDRLDMYKVKSSDLRKNPEIMVNGVKWGMKNYFQHIARVNKGIILNDLTKEEAYEYFQKYC